MQHLTLCYTFLWMGSGDVSLILLAFANIFMFMGFGLIALSKFYDLYNNEHIQAVKELIERLKDQVRSVALEREQNANIQQHEVLVITSASQQEQERHPSITRESCHTHKVIVNSYYNCIGTLPSAPSVATPKGAAFSVLGIKFDMSA